jgi:hypothetical protein
MKKVITTLIFTIGTFHGALQVLKLLPPNPMTNFYAPLVNMTDPGFFPQKWLLFAPEPPTYNYRMHYRCNKERWIDPIEKALLTHQRNRLSPDQYIVRYYKDSIRAFSNVHSAVGKELSCSPKDPICYKKTLEALKARDEYLAIHQLAMQLCQKRGYHTGSVQIRSLFSKPIDWSKRLDTNAKPEITIHEYSAKDY